MLYADGITRGENCCGKVLRWARNKLCTWSRERRKQLQINENFHIKAAEKLSKELSIVQIIKTLRYTKDFIRIYLNRE